MSREIGRIFLHEEQSTLKCSLKLFNNGFGGSTKGPMATRHKSTGIREGDPPILRIAPTTKSQKKKADRPHRTRNLIFAYSSCLIPLIVFLLNGYVMNAGISVAAKQCLLVLLLLPCGVSGVLSIVSLAATKTTDDFVGIIPGAFFGVLGSAVAGFVVMFCCLIVGSGFGQCG